MKTPSLILLGVLVILITGCSYYGHEDEQEKTTPS
jgi:hypothetical protein